MYSFPVLALESLQGRKSVEAAASSRGRAYKGQVKPVVWPPSLAKQAYRRAPSIQADVIQGLVALLIPAGDVSRMAVSARQPSVGVAARRLIVGSGARQLLIMLGMLEWRCEPPQARRSLGVRATARTTARKRARAIFSWVVSAGLREYLTVIAFADRSVPVRSKRSS